MKYRINFIGESGFKMGLSGFWAMWTPAGGYRGLYSHTVPHQGAALDLQDAYRAARRLKRIGAHQVQIEPAVLPAIAVEL